MGEREQQRAGADPAPAGPDRAARPERSDRRGRPDRRERSSRPSPRRRLARRLGVWFGAIYVVLLVASQASIARRGEPAPSSKNRLEVHIPAMADDGPVEGEQTRLSIIVWDPSPEAVTWERAPILLLHGSPGSARNFGGQTRFGENPGLGERLAETGRQVLAIDLPGFGRSDAWVPSYSILAHARASLAALDVLGIERVHLATWSMGGGVALHMADLAPERVLSITQIAAIGVQEAEGSGSYFFEHVKYGFLYGLAVVLPELVPHFGVLGPRSARHTFARNFWDTDQRPLRGIMERLDVPMLILVGRDDFLVPLWCGEESHALVSKSRLVILAGSHFLLFDPPFGQQPEVLAEMEPFLDVCEEPQHEFPRARVDRSAGPAPGIEPYDGMRYVPWWLWFVLLCTAWWLAPEPTLVAVGVLTAGLQLDVGLALIACAVALTSFDLIVAYRARERGETSPATLWRWVMGLAWTLVVVGISAWASARIRAGFSDSLRGWFGLAVVWLILWIALRALQYAAARPPLRGLFLGRGTGLRYLRKRLAPS